MSKKKKSIATRFSSTTALLLVGILILGTAVTAVMIDGITRDASSNYARFYSTETVDKLAMHLNREIALMDHVARSNQLIEWFADENDPEKKEAAREILMHYTDSLRIPNLYFVIDASKNEYAVDFKAPDVDFSPYDQVAASNPQDTWYFECLQADSIYTINMDVDKVSLMRRLWINHKISKDGEVLGIFCSAIPFDTIFAELFGKYDTDGVIGFIIDENGYIQMESRAESETARDEDSDPFVMIENRPISDVNSDPAFLSVVDNFLRRVAVRKDISAIEEPEIIRLRHDGKSVYVSISHIRDTDWSVVTIFNPGSLFDITRLIPLTLVILAAIALYYLVNSFLLKRVIFNPVQKLTESVPETYEGESNIYGVEREDEIGVLAKTIRDQAKKIMDAHIRAMSMLNTAPLACKLWTKDLNLLECNEEAIKLFNVRDKREFMERFYELSPDYQPNGRPSAEMIVEYVDTAFASGRVAFEWMHQQLDKTPLPSEVTLVRVEYADGFVVAGYVRDLREHKKMMCEIEEMTSRIQAALNEAQAANRAKSEFLSNMSHEIRTPINAVLGITEILLDDKTVPDSMSEPLYKIYNSSDLLLSIINDILDLSKIEAGKMELMPADYEIASLINDSVQINMMRFHNKPVEFKLKVDEQIPSRLFGDALRIKQVLSNLLSNAAKYTNSGEVVLSVTAEPAAESPAIGAGAKPDVTVVFRVRDTGQGMTAEQVSKLFDDYTRFNPEENLTTEGTGLGMSIVKNLIQMMNGKILVESEPGKGSVFTVRLPQGDEGAKPLGKEVAENLQRFNTDDLSHIKRTQVVREYMPYGSVLVVDDTENNLYVAKGLLSPYGLRVETAVSGFEAVDKIKSGNVYDLVFMDHMMPVMDGIEAVRIIRETGYDRAIVALTANAVIGQEEIFMKNGFDDFISKPIDIRMLNNSLNKYIRDKQPADVIKAAQQEWAALQNSDSAVKNGGPEPEREMYPELVESALRDMKKALSAIEEIYKENTYQENDKIDTYVIYVHAMKSVLANIGDQPLSQAAARLEHAGKERDIAVIRAETPAFMESLKAVITKLTTEQKNNETGDDAAGADVDTDIDIEFLCEKLLGIKDLCEAYDIDAAKGMLESIGKRNWSQQTKEVLSTIKGHLLYSDFDEAASAASEYAATLRILHNCKAAE